VDAAKRMGIADLEQTVAQLALQLDVVVNLKGEGPAQRWKVALQRIIYQQFVFSKLRVALEESIDVLSPVAIMGLDGVRRLNPPDDKPGQQYANPEEKLQRWLKELVAKGTELFNSVNAIKAAPIEGAPPADQGLDTVLSAELLRLNDVVDGLTDELRPRVAGPPEDLLAAAQRHTTELGEMVDLARRYSEGQYEVLLNKMSRAFQKPDFCLRRDAFGDDADRLLPLSLSWDNDWYYGYKVRVIPKGDTASETAQSLSDAKETATGAPAKQ